MTEEAQDSCSKGVKSKGVAPQYHVGSLEYALSLQLFKTSGGQRAGKRRLNYCVGQGILIFSIN